MKRTRNGQQRTVKRARKTGPTSFKAALAKASAVKETNHIDQSLAGNVDTTGSIYLINPIAEGTGPDERLGKKLLLKSLQCRGLFTNGTGVNKNAIIIVYDKKPRESIPAINDIIDTSSSLAMNEDNNSSRFSILKRIDFASAPDGGNGACSAMSIDFFLDLKGLPMEYINNPGGGITGIETGAMYFVTIGDKAAGDGPGLATCWFRTRFVDL